MLVCLRVSETTVATKRFDWFYNELQLRFLSEKSWVISLIVKIALPHLKKLGLQYSDDNEKLSTVIHYYMTKELTKHILLFPNLQDRLPNRLESRNTSQLEGFNLSWSLTHEYFTFFKQQNCNTPLFAHLFTR